MERKQVCLHCGGSDILLGLILDQTADAGNIGLQYKKWRILRAPEPLHADLCRACGTVLRFYVKECGREWIVDKGLAQSVALSKPPER